MSPDVIQLLLDLLGQVSYPLAAPDAVEKAQLVQKARTELSALLPESNPG